MTLSELRGWVRTLLQETTAAYWTDTELNRNINDAIKRVAVISPADLLGELTGEATYDDISAGGQFDLPDDFLAYINATWDGEYCTKIPMENVGVMSKNSFYEGTTASPKCHIWENVIHFYPTTGAEYYLYYVKVPSTLSSDTDSNPLNNVLDYAVVLQAVSVAFSKDDPDQALKYKELFLTEMKEIRGEQRRV